MRKLLGFGGLLLFVFSLSLAIFLLYQSKLSGAEFVAFVIAFAIIGAIIGFAPEVQEFSVAGNVVKLREMKQDVIEAVEGLKITRTELLRSGLRKIVGAPQHSVATESSLRNIEFWAIVDLAKKFKVIKDLKPELLACIEWLHFSEKGMLAWFQQGELAVENFSSINAVQYAMVLNRPEIRRAINSLQPGIDVDACAEKIFGEMARIEALKKTLDEL